MDGLVKKAFFGHITSSAHTGGKKSTSLERPCCLLYNMVWGVMVYLTFPPKIKGWRKNKRDSRSQGRYLHFFLRAEAKLAGGRVEWPFYDKFHNFIAHAKRTNAIYKWQGADGKGFNLTRHCLSEGWSPFNETAHWKVTNVLIEWKDS